MPNHRGSPARLPRFILPSGMAMLKIEIVPEVLAKFKEVLEEEANDDAVFRIRETKVGGG